MKKINHILSLLYIFYIASADWCSCSKQLIKKEIKRATNLTNNLCPNTSTADTNDLIQQAQNTCKKYEAAKQATQDGLNRFTPPGGGSGGSSSSGSSSGGSSSGGSSSSRSSSGGSGGGGSSSNKSGGGNDKHEAVDESSNLGGGPSRSESGSENTIRPRGRSKSESRGNSPDRLSKCRTRSSSPRSRSRSQSQDYECNVFTPPNPVSCSNSQWSVVDKSNQPNDWNTSSEDDDACSTSSSDSDSEASFLTSLTPINEAITDSVSAMALHQEEIRTASKLSQIASEVLCTDIDATIQAEIQQKADAASVDTSQHHNQLSVHVNRTIETIDRQKQACLEWVSLYFHAYPIHSNKRYTSSTTLQIQPSKQLYELSKNYDITCTFQQSDDSRGINKITILLTPEALTASNISRLLDTTSTWNVYKVDITITPKTNPAIQSTLAQIEQSLNHTATTATLPTCSIDPYATSPTYLIDSCRTMCKELQNSINPTTRTICFYKDANRYIEASSNIRANVQKKRHSVEAGLARCKTKVEHPHSRIEDLLPLLIHPVNALSEMIQSKNQLASWVLPDPDATDYNNVQNVSHIIDESIATCSKQITQALTTYNQKMDTETNMMARNFMELVWQDKPIDLAQFKKDYGNYTVCIGWKETDPIMHQPQEMVWKIDVAQVSMENLKTLLTAYRHSQPQGNPKNVMIFIQPKIPEAMQQSIQKLQVQALTYPHNHAIQPYTRGVLPITDIENAKLPFPQKEKKLYDGNFGNIIHQLEEIMRPRIFQTNTPHSGQLTIRNVTKLYPNVKILPTIYNQTNPYHEHALTLSPETYPYLNRLLDRLTACDPLKGKQIVNHLMAALQAIGFTPYTPEPKIQTQITDAFDTVCNHLTMIELRTLQQAMQETLQSGGDDGHHMDYQVLKQNQKKIDRKIQKMARQTKQMEILTTLAQRYYGIEITPLQPIVQKLKKQYEQTTTDTEQLTFEGMSQRFMYMRTAMHDCLSAIEDKIVDQKEVGSHDCVNYLNWFQTKPTQKSLIGDLTDNIIKEKIERMDQICQVKACYYLYYCIHEYYTALSTREEFSELSKLLEKHHDIKNQTESIKNCQDLTKYVWNSEIYKNASKAWGDFIKKLDDNFLESLSLEGLECIANTLKNPTQPMGYETDVKQYKNLCTKTLPVIEKIMKEKAHKKIKESTDYAQKLYTGFGSISFLEEEINKLQRLQNTSNKTLEEIVQHSTNLEAAVKCFLAIVPNKMVSTEYSIWPRTLEQIKNACTVIQNPMYQKSINTIIEQCEKLSKKINKDKENYKAKQEAEEKKRREEEEKKRREEQQKRIEEEREKKRIEEQQKKETIWNKIRNNWQALTEIIGNRSSFSETFQNDYNTLDGEVKAMVHSDLTLEELQKKQIEIEEKSRKLQDYIHKNKSEISTNNELLVVLKTPIRKRRATSSQRMQSASESLEASGQSPSTKKKPFQRGTAAYSSCCHTSKIQDDMQHAMYGCKNGTKDFENQIKRKINMHLVAIQKESNMIKTELKSYNIYKTKDKNHEKLEEENKKITKNILSYIHNIFTHIPDLKYFIEILLTSNGIKGSIEIKKYIHLKYKTLIKAIEIIPHTSNYQDKNPYHTKKNQTKAIISIAQTLMRLIGDTHQIEYIKQAIKKEKEIRKIYANMMHSNSDPQPMITEALETLSAQQQNEKTTNRDQEEQYMKNANDSLIMDIENFFAGSTETIPLLRMLKTPRWYINSNSTLNA